jgi:hypothetical protein
VKCEFRRISGEAIRISKIELRTPIVLKCSAALFASLAFDAEHVDNSDTSWKKDPLKKLYLLILKIYQGISIANTEDHHEYRESASLYERNLELYGKDYVNHFLCHSFKIIREGTQVNDDAIVWVTKHWRQRHVLGSALRLTFSAEYEVAPMAAVSTSVAMNVLVADNVTLYTQDKFWAVIDGNNRAGPRFVKVFLLKLIVHKLCEGNSVTTASRSRHGRNSFTNSSLKNHIKAFSSDIGQGLDHFWDSETKMLTWLRDHVFKKSSRGNATNLMYLKTYYDGENRHTSVNRAEWEIALNNINKDILVQKYENPDMGALDYQFFEDPNSQRARELDGVLDSNNLADAVAMARISGVITPKLIRHLLVFRTSWQKNRHNYGAKCIENYNSRNGEVVPETLSGANIRLSTSCGFRVDFADMKSNHHWSAGDD